MSGPEKPLRFFVRKSVDTSWNTIAWMPWGQSTFLMRRNLGKPLRETTKTDLSFLHLHRFELRLHPFTLRVVVAPDVRVGDESPGVPLRDGVKPPHDGLSLARVNAFPNGVPLTPGGSGAVAEYES
jgi:hypothetical protein